MADPPRSQAPQNLRFVVANDPDQFRDRSIMRNNRSHVMHNHLSEKRQSNASRVASDDNRVRKKGRSNTPSRTGSPLPKNRPSLERSMTDQVLTSSEALAIYRRTVSPKPRRRATTTEEIGAVPTTNASSPIDPYEELVSSSQNSPFHGLAPEPSYLFTPYDPRIVHYVRTLRKRSPSWPHLVLTGDPYYDHQQPEDITVTVELFMDQCINSIRETGSAFRMGSYSFEDRMDYLGTLALASPDINLDPKSFASIAASDGAHAEAMEVLGRSFSDPQARVSDKTAMAVSYLIARAVVTGDNTLAVVHEEGFKSVLNLRGSLDDLCLGLQIPILSILCLSAIARERPLDNCYTDHIEAKFNNVQHTPRMPHSPLFFPPSGFGFLFDASQCKDLTRDVLHSACKLTSLAAEAVHLRNCEIVDPTFQLHVENVQRQRDIDGQINEVKTHVFTLGQSKPDDDWVYECCRIATTLWATAISLKISLVEAAARLEKKNVLDPPISKLVFGIQQTDLSTVWDNMAGVLLWLSMIGGAAAKERKERSWLLSVSMRCIIVLQVEHKYAMIDSMMKLLKVMQLWTDGKN